MAYSLSRSGMKRGVGVNKIVERPGARLLSLAFGRLALGHNPLSAIVIAAFGADMMHLGSRLAAIAFNKIRGLQLPVRPSLGLARTGVTTLG